MAFLHYPRAFSDLSANRPASGTRISNGPASILALRTAVLAVCLLIFVSAVFAQRPATASQSNVQFEKGQTAIVLPFTGENLIIVEVRVNDSAPMKFLFDTGAGITVVSEKVAAKLKLKKVDDLDAKGVGGTVQGSLAQGITLSVPGVKVFNQPVAVLPLDFPCELSDISGIIGYNFINEFVVAIDYDAKRISLFPPGTYKYAGPGERIPIEIVGNTPRVRGQVALTGTSPVEAVFELDTGSDGTLRLKSHFVKRHSFIEALKSRMDSVHRGAGGELKTLDGRLRLLRLGRFNVADALVSFETDTEGSPGEDNDGPLGNEILRRFRLVIDYSRKQMFIEPNTHLTEPIDSGMSGLEFDSEDCQLSKVTGVTAGSPAAGAGIKPGDEVVAINGRTLTGLTSFQIEKLLSQRDAEQSLTIKRDGKTFEVRIKLRRLL